jgi:hypothetical protein
MSWTTRLLARHAREYGPAAGQECLAKLVQGTVCKILDVHATKPHKIRYYLERRDLEFEEKMAHVLCICREVEILKEGNAKEPSNAVAIISYDEKPSMQAIGSTAPDLPPKPGVHAAFARDHEYKRHGTLSLLAGIDLVTGQFHALVKDRHMRVHRVLTAPRFAPTASTAIKIILDNNSAQGNQSLAGYPTRGSLRIYLHPKHGYRITSWRSRKSRHKHLVLILTFNRAYFLIHR